MVRIYIHVDFPRLTVKKRPAKTKGLEPLPIKLYHKPNTVFDRKLPGETAVKDLIYTLSSVT